MADFTDDFTGTDGDNLESRTGWTRLGGVAGAAEINGANQLKFSSTTATAYIAPAASDENHFAQAVRRYTGAGDPFFFPWAICVGDMDNFIGCRFPNTTIIQLFKRIGGSFTLLDSMTTTSTVGDTIKIERSGTAITVFVNAVSELTGTVGASELLNNNPGMVVRNNIVNPVIDDWVSSQATGGTTGTGSPQAAPATASASGNLEQVTSGSPQAAEGGVTGVGNLIQNLAGTVQADPATSSGAGNLSISASGAVQADTSTAAGFDILQQLGGILSKILRPVLRVILRKIL
ncbi:MAG: hypothetical protein L3J58_11795 [Emcibacter sp.]|nr:hypothetical protein [Emcibacter sp.]